MPKEIRKAAVLGAGLMGAQIAAHLANVGIPSLLLDIIPQELSPEEAAKGITVESRAFRDRLAVAALQKLGSMKPSPVYTKDALELITPGNLEDDLGRLAEVDWVVEAVVENLEIKQALWQKVATQVRPGTVVSSNTSGISIAQMITGTPDPFRSHFLGTHFFNPPRYMKLLELIPTPETDPAVLSFMAQFGERTLGKGIVIAKDTPNFIGNRIGVYGMMVTLEAMQEMGLGPDQVDAITGPAIGRPKSATFRTLDMVGLDTFCHVADNCRATIADPEGAAFVVPESIREMVRRGWTGQKSGQGFFKKEGGQVLALNLESMEYRPRNKGNFPSLDAAKSVADLKERIRTLVYSDDKAGQFVWEVTKRTLLYSAAKVGEIADDVVAVDNAMKWGYNWDLGPFEMWDAIGVAKSVARMEAEGHTVPAWVKKAAEGGGFYRREPGINFFLAPEGDYTALPANDRIIDIPTLRTQGKVIKARKGATLMEMGDGVLLLENHSPKTAIGPDLIYMCRYAAEELERGDWKGLVIGARSENFCVGANAMIMLMEAQDEEWDDIDLMARQIQSAFMALKYAPKPVVSAPYGMTLGGGYELSAASDMMVVAAETYMGLVEVGVGLIPGAGGNKELLIRALEGVPSSCSGLGGAFRLAKDVGLDLQPIVKRIFETIGLAKVATSGHDAKTMGYLRRTDRIVINKDHQLYEAKQAVMAMDRIGYKPPTPVMIPVAGPEGRAVLEMGLYNLRMSGHASEHDVKIGKKLARVLTGGELPVGTYVTEQYLLDLEREAFVSLLGEKKTQERLQHILKTGKPLRN